MSLPADRLFHRQYDSPVGPLRLIASERSRLVRDLVGQLEVERDRQIILRFYLTEEDKASICEDLGLSSLHFNRVLHRARQRYRQLYEEQSQEA